MQVLDEVTVLDAYSDAATIQDVFQGSGGYFTVQGADVFIQLQYGMQGQQAWTDEIHIGPNNGSILPGTTGIRFRNYRAGLQATVSAAISERSEPTIAISSGGQSSLSISGLPVFNPQAQGAKFDGVTDDLAALQATLALIPSTGGILYLPKIAGISRALDLTAHPGIVVAGPLALGLGVTHPFIGGLKALAGFPANTPMIKIAPAVVTDIRTLLCGFSLDGINLAQDGILCSNTSTPRIVGVSGRNFLRDGIRFTGGGSNYECFDTYMLNCGGAGYHVEGIFCRFVRAHADACNYGFELTSATNGVTLIENCHLEAHTLAAINVTGAGGGHIIQGNKIASSVGGAKGIVLGGTGPAIIVQGNNLGGGTVLGDSPAGIEVTNPNASIVGNSISGYDNQIVMSGSGGCVVGNVLELGVVGGIRIDNGASQAVAVTGNTVRNVVASLVRASGNFVLGANSFSGTVAAIWTDVVFTGVGWSQLAGYRTSAYYKDPQGTVHLLLAGNSGAAGTTAFTLPAGYRPAATVAWTARGDDGIGTSAVFGRITSAGAVIADVVRGGANPSLAFYIAFPTE